MDRFPMPPAKRAPMAGVKTLAQIAEEVGLRYGLPVQVLVRGMFGGISPDGEAFLIVDADGHENRVYFWPEIEGDRNQR